MTAATRKALRAARAAARKAFQDSGRTMTGVVISAGHMEKTVNVRIGLQQWENHIKKVFNRHKNLLVHDPNDSLRVGDIISFRSGWRVTKTVRHVVDKLIAPFGTPAEERPPIPTRQERKEILLKKKEQKAIVKSQKKASLKISKAEDRKNMKKSTVPFQEKTKPKSSGQQLNSSNI